MKTPAGQECKYYYQDFHRGRNVQECRLVKGNLDSERWRTSDCEKCPVPNILLANADPDMVLSLTIKRGFLGFGRTLVVTAKSRTDGTIIDDPYVGRVDSKRQGLDLFKQAIEDINDND